MPRACALRRRWRKGRRPPDAGLLCRGLHSVASGAAALIPIRCGPRPGGSVVRGMKLPETLPRTMAQVICLGPSTPGRAGHTAAGLPPRGPAVGVAPREAKSCMTGCAITKIAASMLIVTSASRSSGSGPTWPSCAPRRRCSPCSPSWHCGPATWLPSAVHHSSTCAGIASHRPTFSDALALVRRELWAAQFSPTSFADRDSAKCATRSHRTLAAHRLSTAMTHHYGPRPSQHVQSQA